MIKPGWGQKAWVLFFFVVLGFLIFSSKHFVIHACVPGTVCCAIPSGIRDPGVCTYGKTCTLPDNCRGTVEYTGKKCKEDTVWVCTKWVNSGTCVKYCERSVCLRTCHFGWYSWCCGGHYTSWVCCKWKWTRRCVHREEETQQVCYDKKIYCSRYVTSGCTDEGNGGVPGNHAPTCSIQAQDVTYDGKTYQRGNGSKISRPPTSHTGTIQTSDPDGDTVTIVSFKADKNCVKVTRNGSTFTYRSYAVEKPNGRKTPFCVMASRFLPFSK